MISGKHPEKAGANLHGQDSPWWWAREAYSDIIASMDGPGPALEARLLEFPKVFEHTIG